MKAYSLILQSVSHVATDSLAQLTNTLARIYIVTIVTARNTESICLLPFLLHFNRHVHRNSHRPNHCYILCFPPSFFSTHCMERSSMSNPAPCWTPSLPLCSPKSEQFFIVTSLFTPQVQPEPRKHKSHRNLVPNHGVHPPKGQQSRGGCGDPWTAPARGWAVWESSTPAGFLAISSRDPGRVRGIPMFPRLHLSRRRGRNAQREWLKKASRTFLQALADLPSLWSRSHLLTGRKHHSASEMRIFQFARWVTNPISQAELFVPARREGSLLTDPRQAGRRQRDPSRSSWKWQRPQPETAATTGSLEGPVPQGLAVYQFWLHTIGREIWPMLLNPFQVTTLSENNRLPQRFWNNLSKAVGGGSRAPLAAEDDSALLPHRPSDAAWVSGWAHTSGTLANHLQRLFRMKELVRYSCQQPKGFRNWPGL